MAFPEFPKEASNDHDEEIRNIQYLTFFNIVERRYVIVQASIT